MSLPQIDDFMFPPEQIYVRVHSNQINNNNLVSFSPYQLTTPDGDPFTLPVYDKTKAMCDLCFRVFPKWSDLFAHKSKICSLAETVGDKKMVHVNFDNSQLIYIEDALKGLNAEVKNSNGRLYVACPADDVVVFLRKLYTAQITKYNLEQWYPTLEKLNDSLPRGVTSKTIFLELSDAELDIIQGLAKTQLASGLGMERRETNAEMEAAVVLEERINKVMVPGKRYFVRFSTRSPKDSVSVKGEDKNLPITEKLKKKIELLSVTTGAEVLNLITKSQRVFSDIGFYYQYRVPGATSYKLYLMLREFIENLPVDHEFRCYVVDKKITAISQYQCYCKFPALSNKDHVLKCRDAIIKFHDTISPELTLPDYVIDVVVYPEDYSCQVIELNPMGPSMSSGAALYNWITDYNLLNGKLNLKEPSIRILEELLDEEEEGKIC